MDTVKKVLFFVVFGTIVALLGTTFSGWLSSQKINLAYPEKLNQEQSKLKEEYLNKNTPMNTLRSENGEIFYLFAENNRWEKLSQKVTDQGLPKLTSEQKEAITGLATAPVDFKHFWVKRGSSITIAEFNSLITGTHIALFLGIFFGFWASAIYVMSPKTTLTETAALISGATLIVFSLRFIMDSLAVEHVHLVVFAMSGMLTLGLIGTPKILKWV